MNRYEKKQYISELAGYLQVVCQKDKREVYMHMADKPQTLLDALEIYTLFKDEWPKAYGEKIQKLAGNMLCSRKAWTTLTRDTILTFGGFR